MNTKKTLKDRLKIIAKYFYAIALLMIIGGAGVFLYISKLPAYFVSSSKILITNPDNKEDYSPNTFMTHIKTRDILMQVNEELKLNYSYEDLSNIIKINQIKDTKLIELSVSTNDPKLSKKIVDTTIKIFSDKLKEFYPLEQLKIIENSYISNNKEYENIELYTAIGMGTGLILGIILVSLFGSIDVTIKNHEDMKKQLELRSLGIIPDNIIDSEVGQSAKNKNKNKKQRQIKIVKDPASLISESYRMIRTNLDFLDLKVINFTSTTSGEGKSEAISNIAVSFAMTNKKVLIIDCDLRKPMIHNIFGLNRTLGLTDIIVYNRIEEAKKNIQIYKIPNTDYKIDVLSAGSKIFNPTELLNSKRFKSFIDIIKEEYDLVLIDCPPVSLMADAVIVSKITDGTAYIVEYNRLNAGSINACLDSLKDVNACVLGGILTKVNIRKQHKLYGNKYEYYSNYI